jgi:hypothetical protein
MRGCAERPLFEPARVHSAYRVKRCSGLLCVRIGSRRYRAGIGRAPDALQGRPHIICRAGSAALRISVVTKARRGELRGAVELTSRAGHGRREASQSQRTWTQKVHERRGDACESCKPQAQQVIRSAVGVKWFGRLVQTCKFSHFFGSVSLEADEMT